MELLNGFYTKTDDNKLIQNIILEFVSDNLEYKIGRLIKGKRNFSEKQIKVRGLPLHALHSSHGFSPMLIKH